MSELKHIKDVSQDLEENFAALRDDVAKLTISVTDLVRSQASTTTGTVMEAVKALGKNYRMVLPKHKIDSAAWDRTLRRQLSATRWLQC
jgi:hypothetical protein